MQDTVRHAIRGGSRVDAIERPSFIGIGARETVNKAEYSSSTYLFDFNYRPEDKLD